MLWARALALPPLAVTVELFLYAPAALPWTPVELPFALRAIGIPLGVLSLVLLVWVHRHLGRNFSTTLRIRSDHRLVTSGPYRWVRHPMYSVFMVWLVSFFLLSGEPVISALLLVALALVMVLRTPREEAQLRETFGEEYGQYMARTGRYLPRRTKLHR